MEKGVLAPMCHSATDSFVYCHRLCRFPFPNQDAVVVYGAHADDASGQAYADCSPEFSNAMDQAISIGTYGKIHVWRPLIDLHKGGVVAEGLRLKCPYKLPLSC